jgi:hypothetical protein
MPTELAAPANERSTYAITLTFRDEAGTLVTPTAATWTLTDDGGAVINGRLDVPLSAASSVVVVLSGADLAVGSDRNRRVLTVEATYTSSLGSGLPLVDEVRFAITPLVGV